MPSHPGRPRRPLPHQASRCSCADGRRPSCPSQRLQLSWYISSVLRFTFASAIYRANTTMATPKQEGIPARLAAIPHMRYQLCMHTGNPTGPIWFSVGEASGDLHGAELMKGFKAIDESTAFTGMGGPAMEAQGLDLRYSMKLISLVGITEILGGLPRILKLLRSIKRELAAVRPRAIILVDCPEFNFRIAKIAKKLGIPVYYYISPQIWAWRSGRANFLREFVRKVICILPFEKEFYKRYGMDVEYVGHPLMDVLPLEKLDQLPIQENRIGLLPGSRTKEVTSCLLYTSDAADDTPCVDLGGRRIIKKKKKITQCRESLTQQHQWRRAT
eukprot:TRINITY_DN11310_c0_g1_i1.p1 TRINITY_DN11310_c0_g1~~TRINITY_DN11310_c0_g1_i1.p1  ORF type:complete len:330 (-),score=47.93 TRINITY_DN11310_c0_g1_i1:71-1060(-)